MYLLTFHLTNLFRCNRLPWDQTQNYIRSGHRNPEDFDPETGRENRFSEVDQQKLHRFGWYPFSLKLAQKILKTEKLRVIPTRKPSYTVTLEMDNKLVAYRTNTIKLHTGNGGVDYGGTV